MDTSRGDTMEGDTVDALDTAGATRDRFAKGPFSTSLVGREALKRWIEPLAAHLARTNTPRGMKAVIRGLSYEQLAFMALRSILDRIYSGWDLRKNRKRRIKNPDMLFRLELGRAVRDELEFAGLFAAKRY